MLTVGVAPGSYTFAVPSGQLGDCVNDINGPFGYGLPARGWYDAPNAWYVAQFASVQPDQVSTSPVAPLVMPEDPYGTDSTLKGFGDAMTIGGIRVDLLAGVAGVALGVAWLLHHFSKRKR